MLMERLSVTMLASQMVLEKAKRLAMLLGYLLVQLLVGSWDSQTALMLG